MSSYSEKKIAHLLREHATSVLRYSAALAWGMGLGISEVAALEHLHSMGELTPKQLGERLFMSSGAVTIATPFLVCLLLKAQDLSITREREHQIRTARGFYIRLPPQTR